MLDEAIELAASGGGNMIIGIAEFALGLLESDLGKAGRGDRPPARPERG